MTAWQGKIRVELAPRADDVYEDARELQITLDKQRGHELALALMRLEQTTLHVPEGIKLLRLALDAELINTPASRREHSGTETGTGPTGTPR
jgi:hypothetical protein